MELLITDITGFFYVISLGVFRVFFFVPMGALGSLEFVEVPSLVYLVK